MEDRRRLKVRRLEAGLTQRQLADAVGVCHGSISNVERGKQRASAELEQRIDRALAGERNRELVRTAMREYGARLAVSCPACGAQPGQRCWRLPNKVSRLDTPHATRRPAASVDGEDR